MSLVAWYPLNDNTLDYSGNEHDLTTVGTPVSEAGGKIGNSYDFNAGYFTVDSSDLRLHLNATYAFWIKLDSYPTNRYGIMETAYGAEIALNIASSGELQWYYGTSGAQASPYSTHTSPSGMVEIGNWVHITLIRDLVNNVTLYYKNGVQVSSRALTYIPTPTTNNTLKIGTSYAGPFPANLNDVRFYDHVLSEKEIQELVKAKILHYSFNDFQEPTTNVFASSWDATDLITWAITGVRSTLSRDTIQSPVGNTPLKMVTTGNDSYTNTLNLASSFGTASAGETWTATVWVKTNVNTEAALFLFGANSSGTYIDGGSVTISTTPEWTRITNTKTFTNVDVATIVVRLDGANTYQAGDIVWWDGLQVEKKGHNTPFVNGSRIGTVHDVSGYGNDASMNADYSPKWQESSKLGTGSYLFDNQRILLNSGLKITDTLTLAAWVKLDVIRESGFIQSDFYLSCNSAGVLRTYWYGTSSPGYHYSPNVLPQGTWTHVAAVWTGTQVKLYENGINVATTNSTTPGQSTSTYLSLGVEGNSYPPASSRTLDGSMADARIYANALSDAEILELAQTRAQLDNTGNLFLNEITTNGFKPTEMDYSKWVIGSSGSQYGGTPGTNFIQNGSTSENTIMIKNNPISENDVVWATLGNDVASNDDGGWYMNDVPIDNTKTYRLSVWILRENVGNGRTYFGCQANTVWNLGTTTLNNNPYFGYKLISDLPQMENNWLLWVAYIHDTSYSGGNDSSNGIYDVNGTRLSSLSDFKWTSTSTVGGHRTYLYYSVSVDERQYWYRPRMEVIDGNEPTIAELLNCVEHRPLINASNVYDFEDYNIGDNGIGKYGNVSEVGIVEGIQGFWKLNGDAKDYSGNGHDGTVVGATQTSGLKNGAYLFNGSGDYINCGPSSSLSITTTVSVFAWIRLDNVSGRNGIFGAFSGSEFIHFQVIDDNLTSFIYGPNAGGATTNTNLVVSTWYHVGITFDGTTLKFFKNGEELTTTYTAANPNTNIGSTTNISIGRVYSTDRYFGGKIADVRIYNRALTSEEINTLYKYGLPSTGMQLSENGTVFINKEIIEAL